MPSTHLEQAGREQEASRFSQRPALVFWETTKACPLACLHCRATAQKDPLPGELSGEEARSLLRQVRDFGDPPPVLVLTGGDLLMRRDIGELIAYARQIGLRVAAAPAVSPLADRKAIEGLAAAGVSALSLSLDGLEDVHDGIRAVAGTFARTLQAARDAQRAGLQVQVNTVVMKSTLQGLADLAGLLFSEHIAVWEVFFLIPTGRASRQEALSAAECEDVVHFLLDVSRHGILVRTVEAPFLRRALADLKGGPYQGGPTYRALREKLYTLDGSGGDLHRVGRTGTLDGDGIVFVAHDGTITPGGFLPLPLGNVREGALKDVYRSHPQLTAIRTRQFSGPCGTCPDRFRCGGSRARAYAATGDPLASDPACVRVAAV